MIRVGIVEDDAVSRKLLMDYLDRYTAEYGETFTVTVFEDGKDVVNAYRPVYDILLMDIQMEHVDGLSAAHHIRQVDDQVVIVFITSAPQFAIKGYEVNALSYLLKPLPWFAFSQEMRRSIDMAKKRQGASLLLQTGSEVTRVAIDDIIYVESNRHKITVHTLSGEIRLVGTMKDMEAQLEPYDFFRSNSGYLVSLAHVQAVRDQEAIMTGGDALKISRPRKKAFMAALASYAGGIH